MPNLLSFLELAELRYWPCWAEGANGQVILLITRGTGLKFKREFNTQLSDYVGLAHQQSVPIWPSQKTKGPTNGLFRPFGLQIGS